MAGTHQHMQQCANIGREEEACLLVNMNVNVNNAGLKILKKDQLYEECIQLNITFIGLFASSQKYLATFSHHC